MSALSSFALRFGVPIGMIVVGAFLCLSYTRELAKEHKEFGEKWGISRGLSEKFHLFFARFMGGIAIVVGLGLLVVQFFRSR